MTSCTDQNPLARHPRAHRRRLTTAAATVALCLLATAAAAEPNPEADAHSPQQTAFQRSHYDAIYQLATTNNDILPPAADLHVELELPKLNLRNPQTPLWTFWKQPSVPIDISLDLEAEIKRQWRLTVRSVKAYVDFREAFGEKTASLPIFGSTDIIHISSHSVWMNMVDSEELDNVHFGPYVESWKSIRKDFNGHYGLQLRMAW